MKLLGSGSHVRHVLHGHHVGREGSHVMLPLVGICLMALALYFGVRGIEGKLGAIRYARKRGVPLLGLCLGLQCMVIEYARNVAGIADASERSAATDAGRAQIRTSARSGSP